MIRRHHALLACAPLFVVLPAGAQTRLAEPAVVDHVVLAVADLERGIEHLEALTGVRAVPGGDHPRGGTRNALISLDDDSYLEILAPQAGRAGEQAAAWLAAYETPTPILWAVASRDIDRAATDLAAAGFEPSQPQSGSRRTPNGSQLAWTLLTIAEPQTTGAPFLIEWAADAAHPARTSPPGCRLHEIAVTTPHDGSLRRLLRALGLQHPVARGAPSLRVTLSCRTGQVVLDGVPL